MKKWVLQFLVFAMCLGAGGDLYSHDDDPGEDIDGYYNEDYMDVDLLSTKPLADMPPSLFKNTEEITDVDNPLVDKEDIESSRYVTVTTGSHHKVAWQDPPNPEDVQNKWPSDYFYSVFTSIIKLSVDWKEHYVKYWDEECVAKNSEEFIEILELASGSRRISKDFRSGLINYLARTFWSHHFVYWTVSLDAGWFQHICAVGKTACWQGDCVVKKRIKIASDIKLPARQILLEKTAIDKYNRRFDIEIVGEEKGDKQVTISPAGGFEGGYIKNWNPSNLSLSFLNLKFEGFDNSIFGGKNIALAENTFDDSQLSVGSGWIVKDNIFKNSPVTIGQSGKYIHDTEITGNHFYSSRPYIDLRAQPLFVYMVDISGNVFDAKEPPDNYFRGLSSDLVLELVEFDENLWSDDSTKYGRNATGCYGGLGKWCYKLIFSKTNAETHIGSAEMYSDGKPFATICNFGGQSGGCTGYVREFDSIVRGGKIFNNVVVVWLPPLERFIDFDRTIIFHSGIFQPAGFYPVGVFEFKDSEVIKKGADQSGWAKRAKAYEAEKSKEVDAEKYKLLNGDADDVEYVGYVEAEFKHYQHSAEKYCREHFCKETDSSCMEACILSNACKQTAKGKSPWGDLLGETDFWKQKCSGAGGDYSPWESGKKMPPPKGADQQTGKCPEYYEPQAGECVLVSCPSSDQKIVSGKCECKLQGADISNDCQCPAGKKEILDTIDFVSKCVDDVKSPVDPNPWPIPTPVIAKSFGEACGTTTACDSKEHLVCNFGKCACDIGGGYVFDSNSAMLGGYQCVKAEIVEPDPDPTPPPPPPPEVKAKGTSCSVSANAGLPESVGSMIPYLLLLIGLKLRKKITF